MFVGLRLSMVCLSTSLDVSLPPQKRREKKIRRVVRSEDGLRRRQPGHRYSEG